MTDLDELARTLAQAQRTATAIDPVSQGRDLTVVSAYDLQERLLSLRLEEGETLIGYKLGLTSHAKQQQMGVDHPIFGPLTDAMIWPDDAPLPPDALIHPRVEPEIAFLLRDPLGGPGVTAAHVLDATAGVMGALEVIDSRYRDFHFTHVDVIADLASAAHVVLGPKLVALDFDLSLIGCGLAVDGCLMETAAGAAVLGHPAEAVALLANHLGSRGARVEAGSIVLSGALTSAVPLTAGIDVRATFGRLGSVGVRRA